MLGFSINVLTLFGMVLAIGILVDDAIVVIENVERVMEEDKSTPYEATIKAVRQIYSAIIGITLVLVSVFIPMAFFPGSTGAIYRQFAVTLALSISFRSEEHTSELQSLMRLSYAVFCLKKKTKKTNTQHQITVHN